MWIQLKDRTGRVILARGVVGLIFFTLLSGCASMKPQILYQAPQPDGGGVRYVMRIEKWQMLTGVKEEFPARAYNISETRIREMMTSIYRRFFKDPETFVPPEESPVETMVGEAVGHAVGQAVHASFDKLFGSEGKEQRPKESKASSLPLLSEDMHPAIMSKPKPIYTQAEIDNLAPQLTQAFVNLREGEYLILATRALERKENDGLQFQSSKDVTYVKIRFRPAWMSLGGLHRASVSWDFDQVRGLHFRGKGSERLTYTVYEGAFSEEYAFLVIFPHDEHDNKYWHTEFPVD
jgi:hypothetical protein